MVISPISPSAAQSTDQTAAIRSVLLPNGVRLPFIEQGDPAGVPVIFLHGLSDSWRSWETVLPHLPESLHLFAPTQRGHGDADRPDGYATDDFADDLMAFIDTLGIGPAVIVGHSWGSYTAQCFAMNHPERVLGLVLVGSVTTWRGNPVGHELWESAFSTMTDPVDPEFVRAFQESPRLAPERLAVIIAESLKAPARVWQAIWQEAMTTDISADLHRIMAPTLIVWGDQDPLCPRHEQDALLAAIADAQLEVYPGGGHNLHWEEPERFARDLAVFIAHLGGKGD